MLTAQLADGRRSLAAPGLDATCPLCMTRVVPKCGEMTVWHWAHMAVKDCDPWAEPESIWHRSWKGRFPIDRTEVVRPPHRADIVTAGDLVIELQHSPLAVPEIRARESFYRQMIWILDAQPFADHFVFTRRNGYHAFRWKWPRVSWFRAVCPLYLDFPDRGIFKIGKLYASERDGRPCAGWGRFVGLREFLLRYGGH